MSNLNYVESFIIYHNSK